MVAWLRAASGGINQCDVDSKWAPVNVQEVYISVEA
jgi:hypothetical protein